MTVINRKLLEQRTIKLAVENNTVRETVDYKQAKRIGILFSQLDRPKYEAVRNLAKQLKKDGKNVDVLCYLGKNGENFDFLYNYITSKDVSILGKMHSGAAITFAQQPFDYLFYLDVKRNIYLQNILAMSKAKCRIGVHVKDPEVDKFLELMLSFKENQVYSEVVDQIFYYTKKLGCNGN
ncbi:MAG: hypothetical protein OER04_15540 [Cyclobacteriaceae bacterium]|nr:hypothetical protein [Cyclobacteriaceae bacterium]